METLIKADLFFFVTTIAVVVVTIGLVIALAYVIKILRDIREITNMVRTHGELVSRDVTYLRTQLRDHGKRIVDGIGEIISSVFYKRTKRSRPRQTARKVSVSSLRNNGKKEDDEQDGEQK